MAYLDDIDQRLLKKGKLGPLDVYPQEDKQREDLLSTEFVKNGFKYQIPELLREFEFQGSKDNFINNINLEQEVYKSLINISNKREENNTFNDNVKKQPAKQTNQFKPALLHIIAKTRDTAFQWFKLLASNEPLSRIAKRIPVFNRRAENLPEIVIILFECQVPISRAVWYIKIFATQSMPLNEVQKKKRQPNVDPSNEWSLPLVKFLREIFNRLKCFYGYQSQNLSSIEQFLNIENSNLNLLDKIPSSYLSEEKVKNLWEFTLKLARSLMDQNLLDKQLILEFYLDIFEKNRSNDKLFKVILTIIIQNMSYFLQSELLSRRLAYSCCKRIGALFDEFSTTVGIVSQPIQTQTKQETHEQQQQQQQLNQIVNEISQEKLDETFKKILSCNFHKDVVIILTSIVQSIALGCSQALVWNSVGGEIKVESPYNGSPLDFLPCSPSQLIFNYENEPQIREKIQIELEKVELCIKRRSIAIENKWSIEQLQKISSLNENRILSMLDILDKHNYDSIDSKTIDNLYNQLFNNQINDEDENESLKDSSIIHLLCEWSITTKRNGLHRIFYVVQLLKKRQCDVINEINEVKKKLHDKYKCDSPDKLNKKALNSKLAKKLKQKIETNSFNIKNEFILQNILQNFLETKAPKLDETSYDSRIQFTNAITLFYTLIYFKLFSHNQFICTLISRGETFRNVIAEDLEALSVNNKENNCASVISTHSLSTQLQYQDDDLKYNVQLNIQNQQFQYQQSNDDQHTIDSTTNTHNQQLSKLALYALHLPLPNDDEYQHEKNQRFVTIYGFGIKKTEILRQTKKINKDLMKLFSSKVSINLVNDDLAKTLKDQLYSCMDHSEANRLQKEFLSLTYFDQYNQIDLLTEHIYNIFKNFSKSQILPNINNVMFIFDLMEVNMNVLNIILFSIKLLQILPEIDKAFVARDNRSRQFFTQYMSQLYFNIIAVLRLHLPCLMVWQDLTIQVFRCLYKLVKHVEQPRRCTSVEKCVLIFMYEIYTNVHYLRNRFPKFRDMNEKVKPKSTAPKEIEKLNGPNGPPLFRLDSYVFELVSNQEYNIDLIEAYLHKDFNKGNFNYYNYFNFVANIFQYITSISREDVLRIAYLCSEVTNKFYLLIQLWTNAFKAVCQRPDPNQREKLMYFDLAAKINMSDIRVQENLKLFCSHLVALNCVNLNDLTIVIVKSCVMAANKSSNETSSSNSSSFNTNDSTALFSCQMIQHLYTTSPKPLIYRPSTYVHRLLVSNSRLMNFNNTFLLVLKGLFVLSTFHSGSKSDSKKKTKANDHVLRANFANDEPLDLNQFASIVLQEICSQNWIKERCLKAGDDLLKQNHLCEAALGKGPQKLWRIICYPEYHQLRNINDQCMSTKEIIRNILLNLDMWTLRESLMEFKLMIEMQIEYFVDCLAKTTVDLLIYPEKTPKAMKSDDISFHLNETSDTELPTSQHTPSDQVPSVGSNQNVNDFHAPSSVSAGKNVTDNFNEISNASTPSNNDQTDIEIDDRTSNDNHYKPNLEPTGVWLIAPLITQLQVTCHGKVLDYTAKTLQDLGKSFWNAKTRSEKESAAMKNLTAWTQLPFFSLLYSCLKCQEDQKKSLLSSLFNQINDYITGKEDRLLHEDPKIKQIMMRTLHIRLSLVGSMFDFVLRNQNDHGNWVWLLVQLIHLGVVDADTDQLLFTIVIDMLAVLIHHIITLDEQSKFYQPIVRKISKETKDFTDFGSNRGINQVRRLFPLNRTSSTCDVLTVDLYNPPSSKSNNSDKRRYFKFAKKERISSWELIEGVKNASSICLSWYGASKLERKVLKYEYLQKLMIKHVHTSLYKERSYFLSIPELPDDFIEEEIIEEEEVTNSIQEANNDSLALEQIPMEISSIADQQQPAVPVYNNIKLEHQEMNMPIQQQPHHIHHDPSMMHSNYLINNSTGPIMQPPAPQMQMMNQQRMMMQPPRPTMQPPPPIMMQQQPNMIINQQQQSQMMNGMPPRITTPEKQKLTKTKRSGSTPRNPRQKQQQAQPVQPTNLIPQSGQPNNWQPNQQQIYQQQQQPQPANSQQQNRGWLGYGQSQQQPAQQQTNPQYNSTLPNQLPVPQPPANQNPIMQQRLAQQPQRMPFNNQTQPQPQQPDIQLINQQQQRKVSVPINSSQLTPQQTQPNNSVAGALKRKFSDIQHTQNQQTQMMGQAQQQSQIVNNNSQPLYQQQQQRMMPSQQQQAQSANFNPQQLQSSKSDLSIGNQKPPQFNQMVNQVPSMNVSGTNINQNQQNFMHQQQSQRPSIPIQQQQSANMTQNSQTMWRQQTPQQQPQQRLQQSQSMPPYQGMQQQQFIQNQQPKQMPNQNSMMQPQHQQMQRPPQPAQYQNYGPQ